MKFFLTLMLIWVCLELMLVFVQTGRQKIEDAVMLAVIGTLYLAAWTLSMIFS